MPLSYFEKVHVTDSRKNPEYNGRIGVVLGISEENGTFYGYDVHFPGEAEGYFFLPEELKGTGEFVDRSEFYDDNDRIRVRVDGDKGSIVR